MSEPEVSVSGREVDGAHVAEVAAADALVEVARLLGEVRALVVERESLSAALHVALAYATGDVESDTREEELAGCRAVLDSVGVPVAVGCADCGGTNPLHHPMVGGEVQPCRDTAGWHTPREWPSGRLRNDAGEVTAAIESWHRDNPGELERLNAAWMSAQVGVPGRQVGEVLGRRPLSADGFPHGTHCGHEVAHPRHLWRSRRDREANDGRSRECWGTDFDDQSGSPAQEDEESHDG